MDDIPQPSSSFFDSAPPQPDATPFQPAPERPLPQVSFYSIEYPGYVQPASVPTAISTLGGQHKIDRVFKRTAAANRGEMPLLELALNPHTPFAHPVPAEVVPANSLLLKVVRRRRKRRAGTGTGEGGEMQAEEEKDAQGNVIVGEYKAEVVGVVSKTARFRSMADFQFLPDPQDPVSQLRRGLDNMDVEFLCSYKIPPEPLDDGSSPSYVQASDPTPSYTYTTPVPGPPTVAQAQDDMDIDMNLDPLLREISRTSTVSSPAPTPAPMPTPTTASMSIASTSAAAGIPSTAGPGLRLFPPPLFSRQAIPQGYNFKANTASMISTTVDEATGEERKRMINRMRWKGYGPASIMFADPYVPERPPAAVEESRDQVNKTILNKLQEAFEERPIWTRMSLFNQFTAAEARDIINSKILLPLCCYVFQDGPWRDTLIRFSYDPRKDPSSRFYQRLYFRNANHPISRPSVTSRRQERASLTDQLRMQEKDAERRTAHIFDGKTVTKETAAFQLCDITDPMLKEMIEDPDALRETCNERDGWYTTHAFEQIKTVLRHKFFSVLEGHVVTDEECRNLLETTEGSVKASIAQRSSKLRAGKHNMAKGALRPEDAAAMRLRATLDRSMKSFQSQR